MFFQSILIVQKRKFSLDPVRVSVGKDSKSQSFGQPSVASFPVCVIVSVSYSRGHDTWEEDFTTFNVFRVLKQFVRFGC